MTSGTSNLSSSVDFAFYFVAGVTGFFFILITILMVFFMFRYHRKRNPEATDIPGNLKLEIFWTVIPTILVVIMFFIGLDGFVESLRTPDDAVQVNVKGQMWFWNFTYENGKISSDLMAPVGKPIRLNLNSGDVIHSFYIPAMRIKRDVVPGIEGNVWFIPEKEGEYDILCAEYCGLRHSYMTSKLKVVSPREFEGWLTAQ